MGLYVPLDVPLVLTDEDYDEDAYDDLLGAEPLPLGRDVSPMSFFPEEHRREIAAKVAMPRPPERWLDGELAQMPSRAWYEWHWHRRRDPDRSRRNLPAGMREFVIARDGYVCGLCGGDVDPEDVHIDHITPVSRGGQDVDGNLQVSHSRCNLRKGARY